ncbi:hypothetical protein D3C86_1892540 [compost metagenome]
MGKYPPRAGQHLFDIGARRQHGKNRISTLTGLRKGLAHLHTILGSKLTSIGVDVDTTYGVSGVHHMFRHGNTHETKTNPSDSSHYYSPLHCF